MCVSGWTLQLHSHLPHTPTPGVIRAHQCKEEGVGFAYADNREETFTFPYITTLFSASNYCGTHGNKAALMVFYEDDVQVCVYGGVCVWVCVWGCGVCVCVGVGVYEFMCSV